LFERELGMMPQTQIHVDNEIQIENLQKENVNIKSEIKILQDKIESNNNLIYEIKYGKTDKTKRRTFVRKCPNGDCRGFLSSNLKCSICEKWACGDCREVKGDTRDADHTCNKDTIESIKILEKETKECPKCSYKIYRIEGCFAKNTPMLMWDQSIKMSQDITIGDIMIGDDGQQRKVLNVCSGKDKMYEITQNNGETYVVNSKHTLVLKNVGKDDKIEILVDDYMKLNQTKKNTLLGFKSENGINYQEQNVELDPYMLGLWLGDGTHTLPIIASNDFEIQKYIFNWCENHDAELIHDEAYKFRIRRKGKSNGISNLVKPIGQNQSNKCKGCTYKKMKICDLQKNDNRLTYPNKTNPFMDKLNKYNLVGNKHIPKEYMMNSREVRLKLLAGIIDTDGCLSNNGKRITIGQVNKLLSDQISILAHSLGYVVNKRMVERNNIKCPGVERKNYQNNYIVNISHSNLSEIPTILKRKECKNSQTNKNYQKTKISVKLIGEGTYYGWQLDGNHRFIGTDFTVLRNCNQMYCTPEYGGCGTAFDWKTLKIETKIHNPHYYEYMKKQGTLQREAGDIICGQELDYNFYNNLAKKINPKKNQIIFDMIRMIQHARLVELRRFTPNARESNLDLRILYMRKKIPVESMKRDLQKREKDNGKKKEIFNVIQMFIQCVTDIFYRLYDNPKLIDNILKEIHTLGMYTNECLKNISKSYKCTEYYFNQELEFGALKKIKQTKQT
jgi:hypothetical protein